MKEFNCKCGERIRLSDDYAARIIVCPACGAEIEVPKEQAFGKGQESPSAGPGPPPPSPPPGYGPPPLPVYGPPPPPGFGPPPPLYVPPDFEISVGRCIGDGWRTVKGAIWPLAFAAFVFIAAAYLRMFISQTPSLIILLVPPVKAGIMMFCLLRLRGQRPKNSDIFAGFRKYPHTLGIYFILILLDKIPSLPEFIYSAVKHGVTFPDTHPLYTPYWDPFVYLKVGGHSGGYYQYPFIIILISLALILLVIYITFALSLSYFFVMDRKAGPLQAIRGSWRLTRKYRGSIFAISIVAAFAAISGVIALGVGVLVTFPILFATGASIYHRLSLAEAAGVHRGLSQSGDSHQSTSSPR